MDIKKQAEKLYKSVNTFIISAVDADGYPVTKAVVPGKFRDKFEKQYFCTNTSSKFAQTVKSNAKASVYFYSRKLFWKGCLLQGTMEIVNDKNEKAKYWQNKFKNAYPEKYFTDPEFCLIAFTPITGRFYSNYQPKDFTL